MSNYIGRGPASTPAFKRSRTVLTMVGAGVYVPPTGCVAINVRAVGGGGSGATSGPNGGDTVFGPMTAGGGKGAGAQGSAGGFGGDAVGGDINIQGAAGGTSSQTNSSGVVFGGQSGGAGPFGGSRSGGVPGGAGQDAVPNTGSGGASDGVAAAINGRPAGGAGAYCERYFGALAASYNYTVGAGGASGTGGRAGSSGLIIVDEFYYSDTVVGGAAPPFATQAEVEGDTVPDKALSPYNVKFSPHVAKAWVNFNGTGTVAIRKAMNVSSLVDGGVGVYTINFATPMPSADYAFAGGAGGNSSNINVALLGVGGSMAAGSLGVSTFSTSNAVFDPTYVTVAVWATP